MDEQYKSEMELFDEQYSRITHNRDIVEQLEKLAEDITYLKGDICDPDLILSSMKKLDSFSDTVLSVAAKIGARAELTEETKVEEITKDLECITTMLKDLLACSTDDLEHMVYDLKNDLKKR